MPSYPGTAIRAFYSVSGEACPRTFVAGGTAPNVALVNAAKTEKRLRRIDASVFRSR